jgi:hypothetical protein
VSKGQLEPKGRRVSPEPKELMGLRVPPELRVRKAIRASKARPEPLVPRAIRV